MSENKKPDLSRFIQLEKDLQSKVLEQPLNSMAGLNRYGADQSAKSRFLEDQRLAADATVGLFEGDTSALLKFLIEAQTDRLPFQLRKKLVELLGNDPFTQLRMDISPLYARGGKGRTVEKLNKEFKRRAKIVHAFITAGGLDRPKVGFDAAMKATGLGKSSVSAILTKEYRERLLEQRKKFLESGNSLAAFMDRYKDRA